MIRFLENYSLKKHNTFNIEAKSRYFFEFTESDDLLLFLSSEEKQFGKILPKLVIGGASNFLFVSDFDGIVLYPNIPGMREVDEDRESIWMEVGAGVTWDDFVEQSVNKGLGGAENLSLIPGKVGAVPVQNIGAYGVEVERIVDKVHGVNLETGKFCTLSHDDCKFSYRDSIFKHELAGKFVITSVVFRLSKFPKLNTEYGNIAKEMEKYDEADIKTLRKVVCDIRNSKIPDPFKVGNAGSFFKNPFVEKEKADSILATYPDVPIYPTNNGRVKLAAGWLIEKCNWKGFREGDAGVHEHQALVLLNYGNATGKEIYNLSERIRQSVYQKFGVEIETEVNLINQ